MESLKLFYLRVKRLFSSLSDQSKLTLLVFGLVGSGLAIEWGSRLGMVPKSINDPRLLVVERNLEKGRVITQLDLTTVLGTEDEAKKTFTDQQLPIVLGSKLRVSLRRGERLGLDTIEIAGARGAITDRIPNGFRAYSFSPDNDLPVRIGDSIDLLAAPVDHRLPTHEVGSGVEVLDLKRIEGRSTLVVAISEDDLSTLEKARQLGKIVITLRGSTDRHGKRKKHKGAMQRKRNLNPRVQILVEGET